MTSTIYRMRLLSRGRVTIPAPLRRKSGLRGGSQMAFEETPHGGFVLRPIQTKRR
jgi:AbrB family looped-hinge helix DNA binding protein